MPCGPHTPTSAYVGHALATKCSTWRHVTPTGRTFACRAATTPAPCRDYARAGRAVVVTTNDPESLEGVADEILDLDLDLDLDLGTHPRR